MGGKGERRKVGKKGKWKGGKEERREDRKEERRKGGKNERNERKERSATFEEVWSEACLVLAVLRMYICVCVCGYVCKVYKFIYT
jgi:hypothetical protein